MHQTKSLLRIVLVILTAVIFTSVVAAISEMDYIAGVATIITLIIAVMLNFTAMVVVKNPMLCDTKHKIGLWINLAVFNIVEIILVSKYGFQLF